MGGKGEGFSRNMYKGHVDKAKGGEDRGWEVGMAGVRGEWWEEKGDNCTCITIKKKKGLNVNSILSSFFLF